MFCEAGVGICVFFDFFQRVLHVRRVQPSFPNPFLDIEDVPSDACSELQGQRAPTRKDEVSEVTFVGDDGVLVSLTAAVRPLHVCNVFIPS